MQNKKQKYPFYKQSNKMQVYMRWEEIISDQQKKKNLYLTSLIIYMTFELDEFVDWLYTIAI